MSTSVPGVAADANHATSAAPSQIERMRPALVTEVTGEIAPGSATVWQPTSYGEWESRTRVTAALSAWSAQTTDERAMRRAIAWWIFALITLQIVAAFSLVIAGGLGLLHVDVTVMQVLLPSVLAEVFGLGFLVTKFLFSVPVRQRLDGLAHGADQPSAARES